MFYKFIIEPLFFIEDINKEYFSNELISNAIVGNAMMKLIKIK